MPACGPEPSLIHSGVIITMSLLQRAIHPVWTLLPPQVRQNAYEALTLAGAARARRADRHHGAWQPPFVVVGALGAPTGLGESARLLLDGFVATGQPVGAIDVGPALMQPTGVPLPSLPQPAAGGGTLVLAVQPPNVGRALLAVERRVLRGKHRVGHWVWELEVLPSNWRRSLPFVHEIAAPSRFAATTLARGLGVPVRQLGYPLTLRAPDPPPRDRSGGPVTFGAGFDLGSTAARKNPFAVVEAFHRAFTAHDAVRLSLKVRGAAADPAAFARLQTLAAADGRIELVTGDLDAAGLAEWWRGIDVLVSLHRSEGFGLFPAEAMLRGIPVIATDWSATAEFVTAAEGWPVPARLVRAVDPTGRYGLPDALWAEPDPDAAAAAMRAAWAAPPAVRARRGAAAVAAIRRAFDVTAFERQIRGSVDDLVVPEGNRQPVG